MNAPEASSSPFPDGVIASHAYLDGIRVADVPISGISSALVHPGWFLWIGLYEPSGGAVEVRAGRAGSPRSGRRGRPRRPPEDQARHLRRLALSRPPNGPGSRANRAASSSARPTCSSRNATSSVRHGSLKNHLGVSARCEAVPGQLATGSGFVLHALMDFIVDQYFPVVDVLEKEAPALEEEIFAGRFSASITSRLYRLMRDLVSVKRAVSPLTDVSSHLARVDCPVIPAATRPYFQDVYDHVLRINELIDTVHQLSATALNAHLALASVSQNEDTKRLAAWAAILAVPTMIAGLYGMNFENIPELHWRLGYPVAMVFMSVVCALLYRGFKRSGWL